MTAALVESPGAHACVRALEPQATRDDYFVGWPLFGFFAVALSFVGGGSGAAARWRRPMWMSLEFTLRRATSSSGSLSGKDMTMDATLVLLAAHAVRLSSGGAWRASSAAGDTQRPGLPSAVLPRARGGLVPGLTEVGVALLGGRPRQAATLTGRSGTTLTAAVVLATIMGARPRLAEAAHLLPDATVDGPCRDGSDSLSPLLPSTTNTAASGRISISAST